MASADLARVQGGCEAGLDLEPDAGDLPAILHQPGCVGVVAETGTTMASAWWRLLSSMEDLLRGQGAAAVFLSGCPPVHGRQLVVVVRDAHLHDWRQELLRAALWRRSAALVVGTGTTQARILAGPSRSSVRAGES